MERRFITQPSEFKTRESEDHNPVIEGYFSVFNSNYNIAPGYTESVDEHAFDGQLSGDVRALIDHDTRLVLGRTTARTLELSVDSRGLFGTISINPNDVDAMNLYARVQRGDVDQCSFGFDITDEESEVREDGSVHWTIKAVKLYEVSVCTFPAYEETAVTARKREGDDLLKREREAWIARTTKKLKEAYHGTESTHDEEEA